jgi:CRISPR-associated endonuclease/helicase Cas3
MTSLEAKDYPAYFRSLYPGLEPFPWQVRLVQRATGGRWPLVIALPTASGKTSCIDIAIFALACQADRPPQERTAPRRIFFVVDRRVIVDEAFRRAERLAEKLLTAQDGILHAVGDRLRKLGRSDRPLDCFQLRGGIYRDDAWARTPLQPTVLASTVDQIGSRLLYRGFGLRSGYARPLHAGLAANDSLVILDEAHCANPFRQTATAIERYRRSPWAETPLPSPFQVVLMTATPPSDVGQQEVFALDDDDRQDPVLLRRLRASKPARLVIAEKARGKDAQRQLAAELVRHARELVAGPVGSVGILVNRVATARMVYHLLCQDKTADAVLLTGRMRPLDRDRTVGTWLDRLRAGAEDELQRPVFVAATQCLEVGADLDFDGLVTECASLDALRQRFGRLNRLGKHSEAPARIVIRSDQTEPEEDPDREDPVYGNSLSRTWQWLTEHATQGIVDMGVDALGAALEADGTLTELNAPAPNAPIMLPAHLDCWVQTAPVPSPDPDVAVFLHGSQRGVPEVQVVWRADLEADAADPDVWIQTVALCPPSAAECMPVPLHVVRNWLVGKEQVSSDLSDVEGMATPEESPEQSTVRRVLRWYGPEDSELITDPRAMRPGDTLVIPAALGGWDVFGHIPTADGKQGPDVDLGEQAFRLSRDRALLRLTPSLVTGWPTAVVTAELRELARSDEVPEEEDLLQGILEHLESHSETPAWLKQISAELAADPKRSCDPHPEGGLVLRGSRRLHPREPLQDFTDEDDSASATDRVTLAEHCFGVERWASAFAEGCGLSPEMIQCLTLAARWHDLGKADPRMQAWLQGGDPRKARAEPEPLAKSPRAPGGPAALRRAREKSGYPAGARHELLSLRLAETARADLARAADPALVLHLIGSHHGRCRPFAPVIEDPSPRSVRLDHLGTSFGDACTDTGLERLDSGVPERFWLLVRRYGWWGLALLEAILRLADHRRSEEEQDRRRCP